MIIISAALEALSDAGLSVAFGSGMSLSAYGRRDTLANTSYQFRNSLTSALRRAPREVRFLSMTRLGETNPSRPGQQPTSLGRSSPASYSSWMAAIASITR